MPSRQKPSRIVVSRIALITMIGTLALITAAAAAAGSTPGFSFMDSVKEFFGVQPVQTSALVAQPEELNSAPAIEPFAPTAVLLSWNTFGNAGTETTEPSTSNDANLSSANLTLGAGLTAAANGDRFGGNNWFDTGNTVAGNTLAEAIAGNNFIQFIVTPNAGFSVTPTSLVFKFDRSGTGPPNVALRSSADSFATDLGSVTGITAAAFATNTITISGLTNLTTATTFRLYGFGATSTVGTGGFDTNVVGDNVILNGTTAAVTPTVTISPASQNVIEGSNADITISRTGSTASALTVDVNITQGTGTAATDYTLSGGSISGQTGSVTVTIPASSSSVNVNLAAANDVDAEADNTLTLALVDGASYDLGSPNSSTATIPANDFVVTNTNDAGDGSLRQAITNANAFNTNDTITFTAAANGTITLASTLPSIANNGTLTVNGGGNVTISGNSAVRVLYVTAGALNLQNITIANGNAAAGYAGGGVLNTGTLTITHSTFSGNTAGEGGGLLNSGNGTVTISNSTFTGNSAGYGGALSNYNNLVNPSVTIVNSTFSGNSSNNGSFIWGGSTVTNSIIANNAGASGNCFNAPTNGGNNIDSGTTCGWGSNNGSMSNTDPMLGALTGSPAYFPLNGGSPAIDAGNNCVTENPGCLTTPLTTDQRGAGFPRKVDGDLNGTATVDIGSFERNVTQTGTTSVVNSTNDPGTGLCDMAECTLREAINAANAVSTNDTITFTAGANGTITLASTLPSIANNGTLTITGNGAANTIISGNGAVRVLRVNSSAALTLENVTIAGGSTFGGGGGIYIDAGSSLTITNSTLSGNSAPNSYGGGIYTEAGITLTISNSTFSSNAASGSGGGIYAASGTLTVTNSTFSGNSTNVGSNGGGIWSGGTLTVSNSTLSGNSSGNGGGIFADGGSTLTVTNSTVSANYTATTGGGIWNGGVLTITNSTFSSNAASGSGGGIYSSGGTANITNSTFSGNVAGGSGGGIFRGSGAVTLINTIVANSTSGGNCAGTIINGGNNLDSGTTCGWGTNNGSLSSTNPMLGSLAGSPAYFPLNGGSPAIDAGSNSVCAAAPVNNTSQNGVTRPADGDGNGTATCDIGSYEAPALPNYTVTTTATTIVVTDISGNSDTLAITDPAGGDINFAAAGRTFSVNGGAFITGNSGDLSLTGINSITVNQGNGGDTADVGAFTTNLPSLTINGDAGIDTVNFNGDVTFASGESLIVNAESVTTGSSADLTTSGAGVITVSADDVALNATSTLVSAGTVTFKPQTASRPINLGTNTTGRLSLTDAELDGITTGTIQIGSSSSVDITITISAAITRNLDPANVNLTTGEGSRIDFNGGSLDANGGNVTLINAGGGSRVQADASGTDVTAATLSITTTAITGDGIGSSANPLRIAVTNLNAASTGGGDLFLSATGTATIDATGLSSPSNTIRLDSGTFALGGSNRINDSTKINVNGATFAIGASSDTVDTATLTSGTITGSGGTLTSTNTFQVQSGSASAILGGGNGLTKTTSGTVSLSGVNTYTGATTISNGRLNVNGSTAAGSAVSVNNNGTLGGTGTVNGTVNVATGGTNAPGLSPGKLNTGAVTFNGASTFAVEINGTTVGTGYDQLNVTGTVSLGNTTLSLSGTHTPVAGQTFTIVENDSTDLITGTFNDLAQGATITNFLGSGLGATISYIGGGSPGNDVVLTVTAPPATLVVTKTVDTNDGSCDADCSLREAITAANLAADANTITFNIPANDPRHFYYATNNSAGVAAANVTPTTAATDAAIANIDPDYAHSWWSIRPMSALPAITAPVFINGYSQRPCSGPNPSPCSTPNTLPAGNNGILLIEINGSAIPSGSRSEGQSQVDGINITAGNSNNVQVEGASVVAGSRIAGLIINKFSGNGIKLTTSGGMFMPGNDVIGSFIGTDVSGTLAAGNRVGVYIDNTGDNLIGCTVPDERNLISGNAEEGVGIYGTSSGSGAVSNRVQGNFIGTDRTGRLYLGNGAAGVKIYNGFGNLVGAFPRRLRTYRNREGVFGLMARAPCAEGARAESGTALDDGGNVISGNGGHGVEISAVGVGVPPGAPGNSVYGNFIGTDAAGNLYIDNSGSGVAILDAPNNTIGGVSPLGNVIANNGGSGVLVEETTGAANRATGNAISGNSIYSNAGLGIDLTPNAMSPVGTGNGVTPNDAGDGDPVSGAPGPNELQNFPVIATARVNGTASTIEGTLDSGAGSFRIEFFESSACNAGPPNDYGEGQTYLGSINVSSGPFSTTMIGLTVGKYLTATATDQGGNTSEFSRCKLVTAASTFPTVTINQAAGQADPTSDDPINFTVIFSETTTNFATGDVTLSGSTGATTATVTGGGTNYNVAVTGMNSDGVLTATIGAGVATNAMGNPNSASTSTDNQVTFVVPRVRIAGNVKQSNSPTANTNLPGVLVTLSGSAGGTATTDAGGNFAFDGLPLGTYTVTPSMAGKTFDPLSRTYTNLAFDVTNSNFVAFNAGTLNRNLRFETTYANPSSQLSVPVVLTARGNETALDFSVIYEPARLTPTGANFGVACGAASGAGCSLMVVNTTPGLLGVKVTPVTGYPIGQKEVVTITFQSAAAPGSNTPLIFGDSPTMRQTREGEGNPLSTTYTNAFVVFAAGREGDVAGRFTGDGVYLADDVQVMRDIFGGTTLNAGAFNEFQRADCAPYATKGDGQIGADDLQQVKNYVAALDAPQTAGGLFRPNPQPTPFARGAENEDRKPGRTMRIVPAGAVAGDKASVSIEMDARGDEVAASFTLSYDPAKLGNPVAELGTGVPQGTILTTNTTNAAKGEIGVLIDSPNSFERSTGRHVVTITFDVAKDAPTGETPVTFTSSLIAESVSNTRAQSLKTRFRDGHVTILGRGGASIALFLGRIMPPMAAGLRGWLMHFEDRERNKETRAFTEQTTPSADAASTPPYPRRGSLFFKKLPSWPGGVAEGRGGWCLES